MGGGCIGNAAGNGVEENIQSIKENIHMDISVFFFQRRNKLFQSELLFYSCRLFSIFFFL